MHQIQQEKVAKLVVNGPDIHPGANYVMKQNEPGKRNLRFGDRGKVSENITNRRRC